MIWTPKLWTPSTRRALACAMYGKPHSLRRQLFRPMFSAVTNIGPCECCGGSFACADCRTSQFATLTVNGFQDESANSPCLDEEEEPLCQVEYDNWTMSNLNGSYELVYGGFPGFYELDLATDCASVDPDGTSAIKIREFKLCDFGPARKYVRRISAFFTCGESGEERFVNLTSVGFIYCDCGNTGSGWTCVNPSADPKFEPCDFTFSETQTNVCGPMTATEGWRKLSVFEDEDGCQGVNNTCTDPTIVTYTLNSHG
jgi:hypothetical protein